MRNPYRRTNVAAVVLTILLAALLIVGGCMIWRMLRENNDLRTVSAGQADTITALEDTSAAQSETITGQTAAIASLQTENAAQAATIDGQATTISTLEAEKTALAATVNALEITGAEKDETIAALENDKLALTGTVTGLNAENTQLETENAALRAENEAQAATITEQAAAIAALEASQTTQTETIETLNDDLEEKDDLIELYESVTPTYSLAVGQMGYQSWIRVRVVASKTGRIDSVTVLAGREGEVGRAAAEDEAFLNQFVGKYLPIDPDEVDTVAGATVTTQAVIDGLSRLKLKVEKNSER